MYVCMYVPMCVCMHIVLEVTMNKFDKVSNVPIGKKVGEKEAETEEVEAPAEKEDEEFASMESRLHAL